MSNPKEIAKPRKWLLIYCSHASTKPKTKTKKLHVKSSSVNKTKTKGKPTNEWSNKKLNVFLLAPAHPRQASLHQFLIMKMNKSKLSIWNQKHWRCVTTSSILKILSILICEPAMLSIWWTKYDTCKDCMKCVTHHPKRIGNFYQSYT
jgi:hypothetical protein